jgi:hypothetical protein
MAALAAETAVSNLLEAAGAADGVAAALAGGTTSAAALSIALMVTSLPLMTPSSSRIGNDRRPIPASLSPGHQMNMPGRLEERHLP